MATGKVFSAPLVGNRHIGELVDSVLMRVIEVWSKIFMKRPNFGRKGGDIPLMRESLNAVLKLIKTS